MNPNGPSSRRCTFTRREFLRISGAALAASAFAGGITPAYAQGGVPETLYNGIVLPQVWPPTDVAFDGEPIPVPYIRNPPNPILIDVGRQLFVDDFLIERTNLTRTFHAAEWYPGNPVLKPDQPWEIEGTFAAPYIDGAWFDPQDGLYKMWYLAGDLRNICLAISEDLVSWKKPMLDVVPGTNIVHRVPYRVDERTIWRDPFDPDPTRRYKLFKVERRFYGDDWTFNTLISADGIHWQPAATAVTSCGDATSVAWNPFRRQWVYSVKQYWPWGKRVRMYWENRDPLDGPWWSYGPNWPGSGDLVRWLDADRLDVLRPGIASECELYNMSQVAYESVMLGLLVVWRGQPPDRPKINEVLVAFSRDGFRWDRTSRRPFAGVSERQGDWNWGNVQPCGGCCIVTRNRLWFLFSGRAGIPGTPSNGVVSTGLAGIRRDGFASMDALSGYGELTTRPLRFRGRFLFVNAALQHGGPGWLPILGTGTAGGDARVDAAVGRGGGGIIGRQWSPGGALLVEVLDEHGNVIWPFAAWRCIPVEGDQCSARVRWFGDPDLGRLAGKTVRLKFYLTSGSLYSFWITSDPAGRSHGFLGAGSRDYSGIVDD